MRYTDRCLVNLCLSVVHPSFDCERFAYVQSLRDECTPEKPEDAAIAETGVRTESGFDGTVALRVVLIFVDGTDVVVYRSIVR